MKTVLEGVRSLFLVPTGDDEVEVPRIAQQAGGEQTHQQMASFMGDEAADAIPDLMGGDLNDEVLKERDTVDRVTGVPAKSFARWASENPAAHR